MNIIRLRKIRRGDIPRIFKWRNDPSVRKNSFNTKIITWPQHQKYWAGRFSHHPDYSYMIVCDGEGAGVVRLDDKKDGTYEVNILIAPDWQGMGIGSIAIKELRVLSKKLRIKKLVARMKPHNAASQSIFRKGGFREKYRFFWCDIS